MSNESDPEKRTAEESADQAINQDPDRGPSRTGQREPSEVQQENDDESAALDERKR
jgi:hypothetical protein